MKNKIQPVTRSIFIDDENIQYTLKRSHKARYMRLQIKNRGQLEVVLPRGYQVTEAEQFLLKKSGWIKKHIANRKDYDNKYFLLGKEVRAIHEYDFFAKRHRFKFANGCLLITSPPDSIDKTEDLYELWLRKLAKKSLLERVHKTAGDLNLKIGRVSIRGQKTRWGSCSSKGNLSFNYNLLRFRKDVVDYVIIHELCHRIEMNHSPKFWNLVGKYCPDYKNLRKELKEHSL